MATRVVFFLTRSGYEAAWQATSLGLTAAAMGDEVTFVAGFDPLRAMAQGTYGVPQGPAESATQARGVALNAATPERMLADARSLGAKVIACDTTVKLAGLVPAELVGSRVLDEVMGLPSIWRLTEGARVLSL